VTEEQFLSHFEFPSLEFDPTNYSCSVSSSAALPFRSTNMYKAHVALPLAMKACGGFELYKETSHQLHVPAALSLGEKEAGWTPQAVWTLRRTEIYVSPATIQKNNPFSIHPVILPTELPPLTASFRKCLITVDT